MKRDRLTDSSLSEHRKKRMSGLSPAKRALLERRLRGESASTSESRSIQRRPDRHTFPLSFAQERFWFLDQFEPGSPAYNRPFALRLTGPLHVATLEKVLSEILRRHEVLRATYTAVEGRPLQTITPAEPVSLPVIDLSRLAPTERESRAKALASEEAQRSFDLARGPVLRATLLRMTEEEHVLLLVVHHIGFDAWSAQVLMREVAALYEAFVRGRASPFSELDIQYADYAHWQRGWMQGEVFDAQLSYWKEQLAGAPPSLDLPTDRPRPSIQRYRGARHILMLHSSLVQSLKALNQQEDVTLFMILFAAFKVLLHRYTGQDDIVVGTPIAGRTHVETEVLIGFFINTLVLRTDLSGNPGLRELLDRVREMALGAYAHQDLPFEKLVEEMEPERNLGSTPFFQVMFNVENIPERDIEVQNLLIEEFEFDTGIQPFDMTLEIMEKEDTLSCSFSYSTDLFDGATIQRMSVHYRTLLEGIVADPNQRIGTLPLLTGTERHQLLVEWNDTAADFPKDACIHELFEAQVERSPEAVAVVFEDQQLTYGELNARANQLARYLIKRGVGPDVVVGICVERSLEMVIGLWGVLKAGGAYVALDPTYPKERLAIMLEDSRPQVLLSQHRVLEHLPRHKIHTLCLDSEWGAVDREDKRNPTCDVKAHHLAYIIYTSGSTGTPKGVMIEHRSLVNHTEAACEEYDINPDDRVLQFASISFDMSADDIYPCLARGATLVLRTEAMIYSIQHFFQKCREWTITVLDLPTAYWHEMTFALSSEGLRLPPSIRMVIIGGERALPERVSHWLLTVGKNVRLLNGYGPTETTVHASVWEVDRATNMGEEWTEVPIGRPRSNIQIYILDQYLQPVPIGVPGELYIGGVCLARGYLNRPRLTEETFIPNPFSDKQYSRLYRTGDLGRYLPDGNIEFLGRTDHQVKVRGFRIELGDVESALRQHPAVRDAVVLATEHESGDKRLVAYIVPDQYPAPKVRELRSFLQDKLPEYMVPSMFMTLDTVPLTPSGKVDRGALSEPDWSKRDSDVLFEKPRTAVEVAVAKIWSEILGIEQVGAHDSFFNLGGHSLLATRIVSRIRDALHVQLPLRSLFESSTVAQLGALIEEARYKNDATPSILPVSREKYRMKRSPQGDLSR